MAADICACKSRLNYTKCSYRSDKVRLTMEYDLICIYYNIYHSRSTNQCILVIPHTVYNSILLIARTTTES